MFDYVSGVFLESFVAFRKLGEEEESRVRARLDPEEEEKGS